MSFTICSNPRERNLFRRSVQHPWTTLFIMHFSLCEHRPLSAARFYIFFYFLTVLVVGPSWNISSPTPMTPTLLSSIRWHIWGQSQASKDRTKTEAEAQWPQLGWFCRGLDKKIKRGLGGSPSGFPSGVPEWDSRVGSRRVPQGPPE